VAVSEDPTAAYEQRLPTARPPGVRLSTLRHAWFRLDREPPEQWSWHPYSMARSRFDSPTGASRVRYAGDAKRVAMRERFDQSRRVITAAQLGLHLIELRGSIRVLDLRRDSTLDALGLDDQISTSRARGVWAACQRLADLVHEWFGERCDGIVYRSRTTPQSSANLAFFAHAPLAAVNLGTLVEQPDLLARSLVADGFAIEGWR
jgi:hypothetical protein